MCSGYFSSAIAQEEKEMFQDSRLREPAMLAKHREASLDQMLKYVNSAESIYFAGGEPLLAPEHYTILQALIDCKNTNLAISYSTNFTTTVYKNQSIFDIWNKFSNVSVAASLDAHGAVAEYIRHGTDWTVIEQNLQQLKERCVNVNFTVSSTVGMLNVISLIELQQSWHQLGKLEASNFTMSPMISPDHLTVCVLPQHHKQRIDQQIQKHVVWCLTNNASTLAKQWTQLKQYMWSQDQSHFLLEFKRLTNLFDNKRQENFAVTFPEYQDLL
jgi:sulfatase maturation enzyme AslB (radical SAM superfamily)